ncbi:hypothetical protein [Methanolobus psychrotolerans]|uniref:hypothetical protein n=1 Tax=Methanolobus psychrotolerans TaxID=1874706 RepID=UPI000B91700F|nr:hypothetical protein [Methanolobus psychrotolerans]
MKWTLDVERRDIDLEILNNRFVLKTKDHDLEFDMNPHIAYRMLMQLKAILQPPRIPDEEMVEFMGDKTLIMGFVLNHNDHWVMDLRFGDAAFYAEMSFKDLGRFSQVLGEYFESAK